MGAEYGVYTVIPYNSSKWETYINWRTDEKKIHDYPTIKVENALVHDGL